MTESADGMTCTRSGMVMSRRLRDGLTDVFITRVRAGRRSRDHVRLGGSFYCPGCGTAMRDAECPNCGGVLDEFIWPIIELHPHQRG
jgi:rubrerythrin